MILRLCIVFGILVFCDREYASAKISSGHSYPFSFSSQSSEGSDVQSLFAVIEKAIQSRSIETMVPYFASIVRIGLYSEEKLMSIGQAYAALSNFFSSRRVLSFSFSTIAVTSSLPYAIGQLRYAEKGVVHYAQVYITLGYENSHYQIIQVSIYE